MAFLNRVGNFLRQTAGKHVSSEFSASKVSLFQAIRCMSSSSKLFVGGLSYSTDDMSLKEAFSQHGEVIEARVILDRETGRSRGFGFVTYTSTEDASSAMQAFDGQDLHGRRIRVNYATEKPRGGGFGGGFGPGGYGQGGNYGRGGYQGGNYPRADGNFGGGGGFGGNNQYLNRGGGFGDTNNYPMGGGVGFGGNNQYPSRGGGFGDTDNYPSGGDIGYDHGSSAGKEDFICDTGEVSVNEETTTSVSDANEDDTEGFDEAGREELVENNKDEDGDDDEPNDYANTRR